MEEILHIFIIRNFAYFYYRWLFIIFNVKILIMYIIFICTWWEKLLTMEDMEKKIHVATWQYFIFINFFFYEKKWTNKILLARMFECNKCVFEYRLNFFMFDELAANILTYKTTKRKNFYHIELLFFKICIDNFFIRWKKLI